MSIYEAIISRVLDFGVLGLWTGVLLYEKFKIEKERNDNIKEFKKILSDNTETLKRLEFSFKKNYR